jgi:hypothetical protein
MINWFKALFTKKPIKKAKMCNDDYIFNKMHE